jgi:hypothetical protein
MRRAVSLRPPVRGHRHQTRLPQMPGEPYDPSAVIPGTPPAEVPPGFGPQGKPTWADPVPFAEGRVVRMHVGPTLGGSVMIVMTDAIELTEVWWPPQPSGDDVYFLGLDPSRRWTLYLNGEASTLNVNTVGYAWMFVRGPTVKLGLASRPG